MDLERLSPEQIRQRIVHRPPRAYGEAYPAGFFPAPPAPAAVLMPLFRHQDGWRLLFIRRADSASDRHAGQVAFPGGRLESADGGPVVAALREAREEIGLDPSEVCVLGSLGAYRTVTNFVVTPVVGIIPWPLALTPAITEVSRIFSIPLSWLGRADSHRLCARTLGPAGTPIPVVYFEPYDGEILWGVSARITLGLIEALGERPAPIRSEPAG